MKLLIWLVFAFCALVWTGGAAALAAALQWCLGLLGSGQLLDVGKAMASLPLPAWLTLWVNAGDLSALLNTMVAALEWLQQAWPGVAAALQWLVPAVWLLWGLGLLLMVGAAAGLHVLVGRNGRGGMAQGGVAG